MTCERTIQTHRYHDRELSAVDHRAHEAHLRACSECRQLLDELRAISRLTYDASLRPIPAGLLERLEQKRPESADRAILRITGWFTAAAASILIGAVLTWPVDRVETSSTAQAVTWETVAMTSAAEINDSPNSELLVVAQWIADDLSSTQNGELR